MGMLSGRTLLGNPGGNRSFSLDVALCYVFISTVVDLQLLQGTVKSTYHGGTHLAELLTTRDVAPTRSITYYKVIIVINCMHIERGQVEWRYVIAKQRASSYLLSSDFL